MSTAASIDSKIVVVTGASSGFGALVVRVLGASGHTVYAGMRDTSGRNASAVVDLKEYASAHAQNLHALEMDVSSEEAVEAAISQIIAREGRLDVIVHNAGHMVLGPAEAFTPEQFASVFDTNVLGAQRVNRAALPHLRSQHDGLVVWIGSTSTRGGCPHSSLPTSVRRLHSTLSPSVMRESSSASASTRQSWFPAHTRGVQTTLPMLAVRPTRVGPPNTTASTER